MIRHRFISLLLIAGTIGALAAAENAPENKKPTALPFAVTVAGNPAFTLTLPDGWTALTKNDKTTLLPTGGHPHVQVLPVASATVDAAVAEAANLIASEVTEFKPTTTTDLTIAGAQAKQLIGKGTEADDGDPSNAEVAFFTVGKQVFVLVSHGEGDGPTKAHGTIAAVLSSITAAK